GHLLGDLAAPLVAGLARLAPQVLDAGSLLVDDLLERFGDLAVDAAEVVVLEPLLALLTELLEQLAHALDLTALAVLEALLHQPAQSGVDVAVVDEIVGDLRQDRVGVEVEPDLCPVPARIAEPTHGARLLTCPRVTPSIIARRCTRRPSVGSGSGCPHHR